MLLAFITSISCYFGRYGSLLVDFPLSVLLHSHFFISSFARTLHIIFFGGSQNTLWNRGSRTLFSRDGKHPFHVPLVLLTVEMVSGMLKVISWELTGFCDQLLWGNSGLNKFSEFLAIGLAGIIYVLLHTASLWDMNRAFTFKQAPLAMQSHCYRKPWREPMSQGNFEKRNSRPVIFNDHRQSSSPSQPSTSHPWNDRVGLLPKDC